MTTRSTTLAVGQIIGRIGGIVYTVPAGNIAIVKDVRLHRLELAPADISVYAHRTSPNHSVSIGYWAQTTELVLGGQPWVVLSAADELGVYSSLDSVSYWISGAELPVPF